MGKAFADRIDIEQWSANRASFDVVIDARSEREFALDHIPGALNLPVVHDAEYAEVGTLHKHDTHQAYLVGVHRSLSNISEAIATTVSAFPRDARILVYCFRGGKRSKLWTDVLATIGFRTARLQGGWKAYRAWVRDALDILPRQLQFKVLCGPTGCGKTRLLHSLRRAGAQVLDLEAIARHRGSLIGDLPGVSQPSQKLFDSLLLAELASFDRATPIWVEAESKKIGALTLPDALLGAIRQGAVFRVETTMAARVALWREDYAHFESDPESLLSRLAHLRPLIGGDEFEVWRSLAASKAIPQLFERLMIRHYDPAYARSITKNYSSYQTAPQVRADNLSSSELDAIARQLAAL